MKQSQRYLRFSVLLILLISFSSAFQAQSLSDLIKENIIPKSEKNFNAYLLDKFRNKKNLYINTTTKDIQKIKQVFPEEVHQSILVADQVSRNFFLFRYEWDMEKTNIPYQFEREINWSFIPSGDPEWCYMLNRHKYWIDLGKAYQFTGNEKYARVWTKQVTDWIKKNKVNDLSLRRLSWRRIEAGIRCENWIKSFEYFKQSKLITPEFFAMFLNSLYEHAEFINSSFSDFSKTSNWGVLEYHGLINVAMFMPEFRLSDKWKSDAIDKLEICANLQVLPDGTQWEQSPMYHNEVMHCLLNTNYLAQRNHTDLPESLVKQTKLLVWANIKWMKPNHHQPLTGDSDDSDLSSLLTTAALVFKTDSFKIGKNTLCDYENAFHFKLDEQLSFNQMQTYQPDFTSFYLQSTGDFIMRNSWKDDSPYMLMRLKKIGCGHAHDDVLHLSLFAHGKDYLVDGGRYTYTETPERKLLKSSESHNVPSVDNQPHSVYLESWSNSFNNASRNVQTITNSFFDYAEADITGYMRLDDPVLANRKVFYLKPGLWLVMDAFFAKSEHVYAQKYHFPDNQVKLLDDAVISSYPDKNIMIQSLKSSQISADTSVWSPEYNLLKKNTAVAFTKKQKGFTSMMYAIYFPDETKFSFSFLPIVDRDGKNITSEYAEAIAFDYNDKHFILFVLHQPVASLKPFYKVKNQFITGSVVLLEQSGEKYIYHKIIE